MIYIISLAFYSISEWKLLINKHIIQAQIVLLHPF